MRKSPAWNSSLPLWAVSFAAAVLVSSGLWADEPASCPLQAACREVAVPMLSKVPYVSRLFRKVGVHCDGQSCNEAERLGIDFDFVAAPPAADCHGDKCTAACSTPKCEAGSCPTACTTKCSEGEWKTDCKGCPEAAVAHAAEAECGSECACPCSGPVTSCPVANHPLFGFVVRHAGPMASCPPGVICCTAKACSVEPACTTACNAGEKVVKSGCCCTKEAGGCGCADLTVSHIERGLWERIVEATAAATGAEAALEMQESLASTREELLDALVESHIENAALAAKLEAQESVHELAAEVRELYAENARLKAHQELASQKEDLMREALQLAIENERLKVRVAEFERHQPAARTAAKPDSHETH